MFVHINIDEGPYEPHVLVYFRRGHISPISQTQVALILHLLQKHSDLIETVCFSNAEVGAPLPSLRRCGSGGDALTTQQRLLVMQLIQSVCFMTFADLI